MLLEEIFPVAAYLSGYLEGNHSLRPCRRALAPDFTEFVQPIELEFRCEVRSLVHSAVSDGRIKEDARPLADRDLEGLIGWVLMQRG